MRKLLFSFFIGTMLWNLSAGEASWEKTEIAGWEAIVLKNDSVSLTIVPRLGGRIVQLCPKIFGRNILHTFNDKLSLDPRNEETLQFKSRVVAGVKFPAYNNYGGMYFIAHENGIPMNIQHTKYELPGNFWGTAFAYNIKKENSDIIYSQTGKEGNLEVTIKITLWGESPGFKLEMTYRNLGNEAFQERIRNHALCMLVPGEDEKIIHFDAGRVNEYYLDKWYCKYYSQDLGPSDWWAFYNTKSEALMVMRPSGVPLDMMYFWKGDGGLFTLEHFASKLIFKPGEAHTLNIDFAFLKGLSGASLVNGNVCIDQQFQGKTLTFDGLAVKKAGEGKYQVKGTASDNNEKKIKFDTALGCTKDKVSDTKLELPETLTRPVTLACDYYFENRKIASVSKYFPEERVYRKYPRPAENHTSQIFGDTPGFMLWGDDSMRKISFNETPSVKIPVSKGIELSAASNERESYQILFKAKKPFNNLEFAVSSLKDNKGHVIPETDIKIHNVLYYSEKDKKYPDGLLKNNPFDLKDGDQAHIWLTVYAPPFTSPGAYNGTIKISADGSPGVASIPLTFNVFDFQLPSPRTLRTFTDFQSYRNSTAVNDIYDGKLNKEKCRQLAEEYYNLVAEYNLSGNHLPDFPEVRKDFRAKYNTIAATYNTPSAIDGNPRFSPEYYRLFWKSYLNKLELHKKLGIYDISIAKVWDEPHAPDIAMVKRTALMLREFDPQVKTFIAFRPDKDLDGLIDIWSPGFELWLQNFDTVQECIKRKEKVWIYGHDYVQFDNYDPLKLRANYWSFWKYGITGTHRSYGNGLKYFIHDNKSELYPYPTIRMAVTRDGIDDYEYLVILRDLLSVLKNYPQHENLIKEAENIIKNVHGMVNFPSNMTNDPQDISENRKQIAETIVKIRKVLDNESPMLKF
ncbi:MAG: hypothetical protein A2017_05860 [Lentisphaerae bacterium GWF2_44_16]|nr:MAG: hypothetical protein A2017_05860 [Lentisphaerae bacterium GWF2_44_16]